MGKRSRQARRAAAASNTQQGQQPKQGPAPAGQGKITVVRTGDVREVTYREGITVKQAIKEAQFTVDQSSEVRVNNQTRKNLDTLLQAGDQVMIVGNIRGA